MKLKWILLCLGAGVLCGRYLFPPALSALADGPFLTVALDILVLAVGVQMGSDRTLPGKIRRQGLRVLLVTVGVVAGTLVGGLLAGVLLGLAPHLSGAVAAGFGWYSISAVILKELAGNQVATLAFLSNVFRELLAFAVIPLVARYLGNYAAIAPGGATAMDTTLPVILRSTDEATGAVAVITGVLCSALAPLLVTLIYGLG